MSPGGRIADTHSSGRRAIIWLAYHWIIFRRTFKWGRCPPPISIEIGCASSVHFHLHRSLFGRKAHLRLYPRRGARHQTARLPILISIRKINWCSSWTRPYITAFVNQLRKFMLPSILLFFTRNKRRKVQGTLIKGTRDFCPAAKNSAELLMR